MMYSEFFCADFQKFQRFSKFVPPDTPWLCLFLVFVVKHLPNYLSLHYAKLFFVDNFLKKIIYPNENLHGHKIVRAEKQSELKRCTRSIERITRSSVNYLSKRKSENSRDL